MPRRKTGDAKGGQKSPGPKKSAKRQAHKVTTASAAAATARSDKARQIFQLKGPKSTSLAIARGKISRGYEVQLHVPGQAGFIEINGQAEKGAKGWTQCNCLSMERRCCKKHPSLIKVRTGRYLARPTKARPNKRLCEWAPKVLVDKGIIKVDKTVKFRMNKYRGNPLDR